jgi:arylsulfatase A-like enzyme
LTEALKRAGYTTMGFAANIAFLQKIYGFGRGFDLYFCNNAKRMSSRAQFFQETIKDVFAYCFGDEIYRVYHDSQLVNGLIKKSLAQKKNDVNFLFVNYMDAHWPYLPQEKFRRRFDDITAKIPWGYSGLLQQKMLAGRNLQKDIQYIRNQYDASIRQLDEALAEVVAWLKARDEFDRTLIVITSDHGEGLGENGVIQHGVGVGNDQSRVPLIIKFPYQREGKIDGRLVGNVDILPTILDAAGLPWPHECHGRSLRAAPSSPDTKAIVVESFSNGIRADGLINYSNKNDLEEARFIFDTRQIHWDPGHGMQSMPAGDGIGSLNPPFQAFRRYVDSHLQKAKAWMAKRNGGKLSREQQNRLRALGYL